MVLHRLLKVLLYSEKNKFYFILTVFWLVWRWGTHTRVMVHQKCLFSSRWITAQKLTLCVRRGLHENCANWAQSHSEN